MSQVIRISDSLYKRLESHATGFDTPSRVIEIILNAYEGMELVPSTIKNITVMEPSTRLEKVFSPESQDLFRDQLLLNKKAYIKLHYTNGTSDIHEWNASNLGLKSSITRNLHSGYLRDWKEKGIAKAEIVIEKEAFTCIKERIIREGVE